MAETLSKLFNLLNKEDSKRSEWQKTPEERWESHCKQKVDDHLEEEGVHPSEHQVRAQLSSMIFAAYQFMQTQAEKLSSTASEKQAEFNQHFTETKAKLETFINKILEQEKAQQESTKKKGKGKEQEKEKEKEKEKANAKEKEGKAENKPSNADHKGKEYYFYRQEPTVRASAYNGPDCYKILGISRFASNREILEAYLKMKAKYGSRANTDPTAAAMMKRVQIAYEILGDEISRAEYDLFNPNAGREILIEIPLDLLEALARFKVSCKDYQDAWFTPDAYYGQYGSYNPYTSYNPQNSQNSQDSYNSNNSQNSQQNSYNSQNSQNSYNSQNSQNSQQNSYNRAQRPAPQPQKDLYEVLGVSRDASKAQIKKAYYKLSIKLHPDKNVDKSSEEIDRLQEQFKEVGNAYDILGDETKRAIYNHDNPTAGMNNMPPPGQEERQSANFAT